MPRCWSGHRRGHHFVLKADTVTGVDGSSLSGSDELAVNARDAMPMGGLRIETADLTRAAQRREARPASTLREDRVTDTGVGMTRPRRPGCSAEPTTKGEGRHGLGLPTVYGVSGGGISLHGEAGKGDLPRLPAEGGRGDDGGDAAAR
jgi:hypothetical protein